MRLITKARPTLALTFTDKEKAKLNQLYIIFWHVIDKHYPTPTFFSLSLENKKWKNDIIFGGVDFDVDVTSFPDGEFLLIGGTKRPLKPILTEHGLTPIEKTNDFFEFTSWGRRVCLELQQRIKEDQEAVAEILLLLEELDLKRKIKEAVK